MEGSALGWSPLNLLGIGPYPRLCIQDTESIHKLGSLDTTKDNYLIRVRQEGSGMPTARSRTVARHDRRIPNKNFSVQHLKRVGDRQLSFCIHDFSTKDHKAAFTGNVSARMPLTSFALAVNGLFPSPLDGIVDREIVQQEWIPLRIEGLSSIHNHLSFLGLGHGMSPARSR